MRTAPIALALALLAGPAMAAERPVVVELFTSQGCSSCPPADAYLGELARERGDLLPLAFHVTYWNRLGWPDPFALPEATARQEAYAERLGETPFTPQLVVDGRVSVIGSRRGEAATAITRAKAAADDAVPVRLRRDGDGLAIEIAPVREASAEPTRILLVGFDRERVTAVGRGENRGRTLREANIVRALRDLGPWKGEAARLHAPPPAGEAAAVLLQAADGRILGAARLSLSGT